MNHNQFKDILLIPTLKKIPKGYTIESAVAISMIIAHESQRCKYIRQVVAGGYGAAYGYIQMEETTYDTTWRYGDSIWKNALKLGIISKLEYKHKKKPSINRLLTDMEFNIFMARQRLFMKAAAIPSTPHEISAYLKRHWNSAGGAAHIDSYYEDWMLWK